MPAARRRRFFCFLLNEARFRAVFLLRFFSRMAVSYRPEELGLCVYENFTSAVPSNLPPVVSRN